MESRFHQELEEPRMMILQMAALTERVLQKLLQALFERNIPSASGISNQPGS